MIAVSCLALLGVLLACAWWSGRHFGRALPYLLLAAPLGVMEYLAVCCGMRATEHLACWCLIERSAARGLHHPPLGWYTVVADNAFTKKTVALLGHEAAWVADPPSSGALGKIRAYLSVLMDE